MKEKKRRKRLSALLLTIAGLLSGIGLCREPVQAAENVAYVDVNTANSLYNVTQSWDSINTNMNLTSVQYYGFSQRTDTGLHVYIEAPGILGNAQTPDTTAWITATYDGVGTIGGRSVSVQVTFRNFYGIDHGDIDTCVLKDNAFVHSDRSGILLNNCFWEGYYQHDLYMMGEEYHFYYTDNRESISCKGAYMTANSLNAGEGIIYNTEGQDDGSLNTYVRPDHQLRNEGYGYWVGNSDDFTDEPGADDYTRNSVCFQLCTDDPKFAMISESGDYWHSFNVSPLGATLPEPAKKVGISSQGVQVDSFSNVKVGETLNFEVSQKVQYLGVTGGLCYQSFVLADTLPQELTYADAYVTDGNGNRLGSGQVEITVNNGQVNASLTTYYLRNVMSYTGETYTLHVSARVNENAMGSAKFVNQGYSVVNGTQSAIQTVDITPVKPALSIAKKASKYEWQVGDNVEYTITVNQKTEGAVAKNVTISDISLPEGLAVASGEDAIVVDYPKTWTDYTSGATKQTVMSVSRQGNGFKVTLDYLENDYPVTIKVKCTAKESVNGKQITNTATAKADNADQVQSSAKVYINSPKLNISKEVSKFEWQVGDTVDYTIKVSQTENGCQAKNVTISDLSLPEGLAVASGTDAIVVDYTKTWTDPESGAAKQTAMSAQKEGTGFKVTLDRVAYNAPVTIKIKCTAKESVNGQIITNTAAAKADNAAQVQDSARVYINSPKLNISKEVSKFEWQVGDTVDYTIKVSQTESGCQAKNVTISDLSLPEGLAVASGEDAIQVDYTKTWTDPESGAAKQTAMSAQKEGTGFKVTLDRVAYNAPVTIKIKCTAEESVNGQIITNTAAAKADNAAQVQDSARVYINSPKLNISKEVSKYEWRVGDTVEYTIKVSQTENGCQAQNATISDLSLPEGLALSSDDDAIQVDYSKTWTDMESGAAKQTSLLTVRQGTGFKVTLNRLEYNAPVTIRVKCTATGTVNGKEIINTAWAKGDNVKIPVKDDAKIYVNSPGVHIVKECDQSYAKVGDLLSYTLQVDNWTAGTLARNVVISDQIETDGMKLQKNSIVLLDSDGNLITDAKITISGNSFRIETGRTLICPDENYEILDQENGNADGGKLNPEGVTSQSAFTVEYQVSATKEIAEGGALNNIATVTCDEGTEDEDEAVVSVDGPVLDIQKTSDKGTYQVGETGRYTLTVKETRESLTAKKVEITDAFTDDKMKVNADSISAELNGETFEPESVELNEDQNGFTIQTGKDLTDTDKLVINYEVYFDAVTAGEYYTNTAMAKGSNTEEAKDSNKILADIGEAPELVIDKTAEKEQVKVGEQNNYTITVTQDSHYVTADNVVIRDSFDKEGAAYVKDSLKIVNKAGEDITDSVDISYSDNGFTIQTGKNLGYNEFFKVTYALEYSDALGGQTVMNTAAADSDNTDEVRAAVQVKVNEDDPELSVAKTAEKSKVKAGETNTYTIKVTQKKEGETAKNVVVRDSFDKEGAVYVQDSLKVTDQDGKTVTGIEVVFADNGFILKTGRDLGYQETLIVTYDVTYTEEALEGGAIKNTVVVTADNAEDVTDDGTDDSTVDVLPEAPELSVAKTAEKSKVRAGDTNTYTIKVTQKKEGETAKDVVVRDSFDKEGAVYVQDSLKVTDQDGKTVTGIEVVFADNGFILKTGRDLGYQETLTITYDVSYTEEALEGGAIKNTVVVTADNAPDVTDDGTDDSTVDVLPEAPELYVTKEAEKSEAAVGDTNTYTIKVTQNKEGETAKDVVVQDSFDKVGAVYAEDSFKVTDQNGKAVTGVEITFADNGFILKTGKDLGYQETLTITYDVTYTEDTLKGEGLTNAVVVTADNALDATDDGSDEETVHIFSDEEALSVTKEAEKSEVTVGDTNTYTIKVTQNKEGETAKNIIIQDSFDKKGAAFDKKSFKVTDLKGNAVRGVEVTFSGNGFVMNTGKDLDFEEGLLVTYQVTYTSESLGGSNLTNAVIVKTEQGEEVSTQKAVEVKNRDTTKTTTPAAPQTGLHDRFWLFAIAGAVLLGTGAIGGVLLIRKKKNKK